MQRELIALLLALAPLAEAVADMCSSGANGCAQVEGVPTVSTTSHQITHDSAIDAGSNIYVAGRNTEDGAYTGCSDTVNGAYTPMGAGDIEHSGQANFHAGGFYFLNSAAGSPTITCVTDISVSGRLVSMVSTGFPTFIDADAVEGAFSSGVFTATDLVTGTASGQVTVSILAAGATNASAPNGDETEQFELDNRFQIQDESTGSGNQSPSWSNGADINAIAMSVIVGPAAAGGLLMHMNQGLSNAAL